ncbi:MAG: hypothetical protein IKQ75_06130 [Bacteroidales bacterium]|nr:hypothetical protein [Bacteroidales bacterium]MBR6161426.1 hypothetical protein [Bacteroidales bacterium]
MTVKVHVHINGASKFVHSHHDVSHVFGMSEMGSLIGQSTNIDDKPMTP